MISPVVLDLLLREVAAAPSVHNVQPARWAVGDGGILLLRDTSRSLPVGDPSGRDVGVSMGAACEAMCLALSRMGRSSVVTMVDASSREGLEPVCLIRSEFTAEPDPLADVAIVRSSHRGAFSPPTSSDRSAAATLVSSDLAIVARPDEIARIAALGDVSSLVFMRDPAFRRELLSWMRLSRFDRRWSVDGLNAHAMAMGSVEALGAAVVLGPLFRPLDAVGAAAGLVSDASVTTTSSAVAILHMREGSSPFEVGRAFLRAWLRIERAGFRAAVMASLVDHEPARREVEAMCGIPAGMRAEAAWRIGRTSKPRPDRARLRQADLLVRTP